MLNQRGISPLIATVLILGFTVALAAVIMTWGTAFTKKMQEQTEETALKQITCSSNMMLDIKNIQYNGHKLSILLDNKGGLTIENIIVRLVGEQGADNVDTGISLDPYSIKSLNIRFDSGKIGYLKELEILPSTKSEGETIVCSNIFVNEEFESKTPTKPINEELSFTAENSEAVGVLATDGSYIYGKSWWSYDNSDVTISKIGSGYGGTVAGKDYGDVATVDASLSMTYYDNYLYNGYTSNGQNLQRIDPNTGSIDYASLGAKLLQRDTGLELTGSYGGLLITSDGVYVYNLAYGIDGGGYNGFTIRVFDPADGWKLVREIKTSGSSYYTDGVFSDGIYIYPIEWTGGATSRITRISLIDGTWEEQWTSTQTCGIRDFINGQYDWVNNKVWLGQLCCSLCDAKVYMYEGWK